MERPAASRNRPVCARVPRRFCNAACHAPAANLASLPAPADMAIEYASLFEPVPSTPAVPKPMFVEATVPSLITVAVTADGLSVVGVEHVDATMTYCWQPVRSAMR